MLSHKRNVLPLTPKIKLAVSGPNADNAGNMQGIDCHGVAPFLITPVQGLGNYSRVVYPGAGCSIGKANDTAGFATTAAAAKAADATVLVLGLDPSVEYEHHICPIAFSTAEPTTSMNRKRVAYHICNELFD